MTTSTPTRKVGDIVGINEPNYPGRWRIVKINEVNTKLQPENGGRGLNCPHYLITDAPEPGTVLALTVESYVMGEAVRITDGRFAGLYVVIADNGDKVRLAKLGGDNDQYVRSGKGGLIRVPLSDILKEGVSL